VLHLFVFGWPNKTVDILRMLKQTHYFNHNPLQFHFVTVMLAENVKMLSEILFE